VASSASTRIWTRRLDPAAKAVLVPVRLVGPAGATEDALFVLDTGTPVTIIDQRMAAVVGLGEDRSEGLSRLWGPTGYDEGYRVRPSSMTLLGQSLTAHQIRCHHLSTGAGIDGLIGLDVLRLGRLTLDMPWGHVEFKWH